MAISKPILEQTLDEYKKQMSVNGEYTFQKPQCTSVYPSIQS